MNVRPHLIYSHSLECTRVPWESLTSLVISLALVNDLPQGLVIKWFLPCLKSKHVFTYVIFVLHWDWDEYPRLIIHSVIYFSQAA
jgi:hypothetical protein